METHVHTKITVFAVPLHQTHQGESCGEALCDSGFEQMVDRNTEIQIDIIQHEADFAEKIRNRTQASGQIDDTAFPPVERTPSISEKSVDITALVRFDLELPERIGVRINWNDDVFLYSEGHIHELVVLVPLYTDLGPFYGGTSLIGLTLCKIRSNGGSLPYCFVQSSIQHGNFVNEFGVQVGRILLIFLRSCPADLLAGDRPDNKQEEVAEERAMSGEHKMSFQQ